MWTEDDGYEPNRLRYSRVDHREVRLVSLSGVESATGNGQKVRLAGGEGWLTSTRSRSEWFSEGAL